MCEINKPAKIVQIAMAHSEEACVDELFLDENGVVWQWEHKTEEDVEEAKDHGSLHEIVTGTRQHYRRFIPVEISCEWIEISSYKFTNVRKKTTT